MSDMTADEMFALLDAGVPTRRPRKLKIKVVPSEYGACVRCGAFWGNPNPALDFPNRSKVCDEGVWWWRCYNPECDCGYYDPDSGQWDRRATPEQEAASAARAKEHVEAMMKGRHWETVDLGNGVTESRLVSDQ